MEAAFHQSMCNVGHHSAFRAEASAYSPDGVPHLRAECDVQTKSAEDGRKTLWWITRHSERHVEVDTVRQRCGRDVCAPLLSGKWTRELVEESCSVPVEKQVGDRGQRTMGRSCLSVSHIVSS